MMVDYFSKHPIFNFILKMDYGKVLNVQRNFFF